MTVTQSIIGLIMLGFLSFCSTRAKSGSYYEQTPCDRAVSADSDSVDAVVSDSESVASQSEKRQILPSDIRLEKDFLYDDKYTLNDEYAYGQTERCFQWDKIKERLALLESYQQEKYRWAVLRNYKNRYGQAPLVKGYKRNEYGHTADSLGVERYQGIPFYALNDTLKPTIYGRDGNLVRVLSGRGPGMLHVESVYPEMKEWYVPSRYVLEIGDTVSFDKVVFVDRHNQNICTAEKADSVDKWLIRSMHPATTGRRRPPYAKATPLGLFLLQEKKYKMVYLKDGSAATGGFAPYANRFTCGAYIHGVPVPHPGKRMLEYSYSLGTTPRSHMCVRNVTSHSKFIYNWGSINKTVVFVLE